MGKKSFARSQTVECSHCSGAGELYELEHPENGTDWDAGVSLFDRVDGQWEMTGEIRECPKCHGFGRRNKAEVTR